ncbi:MAG: MFS transporter [Faecalibacterium sp.]|nr:MFS transporter [Faecalibacterium sp.]
MKLDTRRTILIGFAFLSICSFWQMYNSVIPLILTNTFHLNETWSGVIMAADNILALFLLPLFGGLSDRCKARLGRRKPFVLAGTIAAVVLMLALPFLDDSYFTAAATWKLAAFIGVLGCLLVAMGTYRSPAVALMPDVTPKPLRSKANAIINLMGAVGGILYLIIASVLYSSARTAGMAHVSYVMLFCVVAGIMLLALAVLMTTVDEPKLSARAQAYEAAHPEENLVVTDENGKETLPPEVKKSLGFLLASIALWFIGYNAIETWFTTYANHMWGMALGDASICLTIATVGAILSYIPAGALASRFGRKKTILGGVALLTGCFFAAFIYTCFSHSFHPGLYLLFALVGVAWASINVNSLPMVVEMCKGSEVGKFTGYYYTFSMAAQTVTPIVAGALLSRVGYTTLFPYAAAFVGCAFVTMLFVKHGDNQVKPKTGLDAYEDLN